MEKELINKNGIVVGKIKEMDGCMFIIPNGKGDIFLNGKLLKAKNRFGKVRTYIYEGKDDLRY